MAIYTNSEQSYNISDLGFDKNLIKGGSPTDTPEMENVIISGVAPKNIISGEISAKLGGSLDDVFKTDSQGIYLGNSVFSSAPFSVDMEGNVIANKLLVGGMSYSKQFVFSFFESLDGWSSGAAGATVALGGTIMQTTATINTERLLYAEPLATQNRVGYSSKNPEFSCGLIFGNSTDQTIYFGMGNLDPNAPAFGLGFKNLDGTISAMSVDDNNQTLTQITGLSGFNVFRVKLDSSAQEAKFYVNNTLKATHTVNIPTSDDPVTMSFYIKNTVAANKSIVITFVSFQQDR